MLDRAQISMWEDALRPHVEDLLAVLPEVLADATTTVLAYELGRAYSPPERRTSAATPDAWTALLAAHVETLFPDADDAAAVTDFLAGALALEFDPPRRIGPRHAPGNRYADRAEYANKNHSERMGQSAADLSLREGAHIAAWQRSLAADVHQIMPLDPLAADALTAALAVRLSTRYKPPCRRTPLPADNPL